MIKILVQKERKTIISDEDVESLTKTEINKLLARNVIYSTLHFSRRMKIVYGGFGTPGVFDKYRVSDHFVRVEFQQRGAPHVHSLLWLEDENGNRPPLYDRSGSDECRNACCEFIDSVISGTLPDKSDALNEMVSFFQYHSHTFTCRKKCRKIKILPNEGHGK